jgi:hypothetical protein
MQLAIDYQRDEVYELLHKLSTDDIDNEIKDAVIDLINVRSKPDS